MPQNDVLANEWFIQCKNSYGKDPNQPEIIQYRIRIYYIAYENEALETRLQLRALFEFYYLFLTWWVWLFTTLQPWSRHAISFDVKIGKGFVSKKFENLGSKISKKVKFFYETLKLLRYDDVMIHLLRNHYVTKLRMIMVSSGASYFNLRISLTLDPNRELLTLQEFKQITYDNSS